MNITIKNRTVEVPSWWSGAGFTVRAGWIAAQGVSYPEACKIVRGPHHARKRPRISAQEAFAEMEKRGLA